MHFGSASGGNGPGASLGGLPSTEICSAVMDKETFYKEVKD